jgi:biotin carboxylase
MKKKILILGGAPSQVPFIRAAKEKGLHVITADYLPDNPGHKLADEYYNISTVDKEKILELSKNLKIDAISAYASDPAALTAAFVCDKLGLVGSSYHSVSILSDKQLFRNFLNECHFPYPWFFSGDNLDDIINQYKGGKAIVKPVDSSGSKGIHIIEDVENLKKNFGDTKSYSRTGRVILEEFIERKGPQIHGEGFVLNGKIVFMELGDQVFSPVNQVAPLSTMVPSLYHVDIMPEIHELVKNVIRETGFETGGLNIEIIRDTNNQLFCLEIGARNGGNFMPQLMKQATGFDLVNANVNALLNEPFPVETHTDPDKFYAQVILHSNREGYFDQVNIPLELKNSVIEEHIFYTEGAKIPAYLNSRNVVGILIIEMKNKNEMLAYQQALVNWDWIITK